MKILSIGNSFSDDAHRYFARFAKAAGTPIETHDLVIGGCPLVKHWNNFVSDAKDYSYQVNGEYTSEKKSISDLLKQGGWDYITIQQVSHDAGKPETFEPYLENLVIAIRAMCPDAKLAFQETWEYEYCSTHGGFPYYESSCEKMYQCVKSACRAAAQKYDLILIPSGEVIHEAKKLPEFDSEHGGQSLYRDGFHMHLVYGRYLLACVWYKTLLKKSPVGCSFDEFDGEVNKELLPLLQRAANDYRG